jgi:uncharacterized iron-regulated membrane protein
MGRSTLVQAHRWVGLALACFLIPAALTGSALVWKVGLDEWLNPELFTVPVSARGLLSEHELIAAVRSRYPTVMVNWVAMPELPGRSVQMSVSSWPHADGDRRINEAFIDPATGTVLGARSTTAPRLTRAEFIPWIYRFHYTLMMKRTGMVLMGVVAIIWTFDCITGALLTLPRPLPRWRKWRLAWQVRPSRLNFDLHRASGLWSWPILFVLALSSVYLNLTHEVFVPAVEWLARLVLPEPMHMQVTQFIIEWQYPLHSGAAFGLAGRIVIFIAGLLITALAVTGVIITSRKLIRRQER